MPIPKELVTQGELLPGVPHSMVVLVPHSMVGLVPHSMVVLVRRNPSLLSLWASQAEK